MPRVSFVRALLLALVLVPDAHGGRLQVCVLSFKSPDEIRVFQDRLPPEDFDVIDVSPHLLGAPSAASGPPGSGEPAPWLEGLCRRGLRCDVVVYSAEFAAGFFGTSGASLKLEDMEEASCEARCRGLFHDPQEVFLLGCNTLATKSPDGRTPAEYLQVLLDHGFDRASAERVVGLRYGPLGPSFRESFRRIFMEVPRIYGFASVAPAGEHTAPLLERYFRKKGDYRRYLEHAGQDTRPNTELLTAFRGTALMQTSGLMRTEPAAADRDQVCRLHAETETVAERLRIVEQLMARGDVLAFLPTIETFLNRHPPEQMQREERVLLEQIRRSDVARDRVVGLVHDLDVSALQLELAQLAVHLEWMTHAEFRQLAVDGARQLLARPLTSDVVDVMCEIPKHDAVGRDFVSDDLPEPLFRKAEGIRLVDCMSPTDERVSVRLVPALDDPDVSTRLWAAYALSRRLPLADAILVALASHLDDPSPDLRARLQWVFKVQPRLSPDVRRAVRAHDPGIADELHADDEPRHAGLR